MSRCPFCEELIPARSGPGRQRTVHCGAAECKRLYNNQRQRRLAAKKRAEGVDIYRVNRNQKKYAEYLANLPHWRHRHPEKAAAFDARRQALKRGAKARTAERFTKREIYDRDGWICGICEQPVDPTLKYPHPHSASLDHVVPLSLDGEHTRDNVRCSHLTCNVARGNRIAA